MQVQISNKLNTKICKAWFVLLLLTFTLIFSVPVSKDLLKWLLWLCNCQVWSSH